MDNTSVQSSNSDTLIVIPDEMECTSSDISLPPPPIEDCSDMSLDGQNQPLPSPPIDVMDVADPSWYRVDDSEYDSTVTLTPETAKLYNPRPRPLPTQLPHPFMPPLNLKMSSAGASALSDVQPGSLPHVTSLSVPAFPGLSQMGSPSSDVPGGFFNPHIEKDEEEHRQIIVGVCAMSKKSRSKPMQEILDRLILFDYLKPLVFEESTILKEPIERWPLCDCLISFHSKGFPLDKAVRYAELRKPMVINDLYMQYKIMDRRIVHQILAEQGIDQPRYAILNREGGVNQCNFVESEDHIEIDDITFQKPFVEKPVSAEDHNVYIYFPSSAGGGSQRLFRKIGSRSSVYSPVSNVRKKESYIYEEFMPTDGTDVKVYTVGCDYAHAEARKAPGLDGKVDRDSDGKEIRYPIILTAKEKLIARKVCMAFKQGVCGFDLLRANGRSLVCDVNGFSFVKTSMKYYDDCAKILGHMILQQLAPTLRIPYGLTCPPEDIPTVPTTYGTMMELRNVIAVVRHGDRTPKQKMKMEVRHKKFFELFEKYGGYKTGQLKLKKPKQLQEILDTARFLLAEIDNNSDPEIEEKRSKLEQLKAVLEMYGYFSGINRKVQLKYQPIGAPKKSSDDDDCPRDPSLVLILKWGGELTPAGKIQAEELGKALRCMYPGGNYGQSPGLGLLRLHSTFRHDLKIYASDEGRVQMTAAAFARGFLALEGELTPILVQMVKSANMNGLLDNDNESSKYQNIIKEKLQALLNVDREFTDDDYEKLASTGSSSLTNALRFINNPRRVLDRMYEIMLRLLERVKQLKADPKAETMKLYHSESWELMIRRWNKLLKDFRMKDGQYDISKIPDIYDCIKYDLQHNTRVLRFHETELLHSLSKAMADVVIPQEYGITREEKMLIGLCICSPLLRKILVDLQRNVDEESTRLDSRYSKGVSTPHRHVRTRLYFTSESHIHSLLTILRYGGLLDLLNDEQWARAMEYVNAVSELNYMTQIVIMMYEDPTKDPASDERYHVELHFSPGACTLGTDSTDPKGPGYRSQYEHKEKGSIKAPSSLAVGEDGIAPRRHSCMSNILSGPESDKDQSSSPVREDRDMSSSLDSADEAFMDMSCSGRKGSISSDSSTVSNSRRARDFYSQSSSISSSIGESWREAMYPALTERRLDKLVDSPPEITWTVQPGAEGLCFNPLMDPSLFTPLIDANGEACLSPLSPSFRLALSSTIFDTRSWIHSPEGWKVPSIRSLETLHNSLTLKQLETFLKTMTEAPARTPASSPATPSSLPYTPRSHGQASQAYSMSSSMSSACSSGGPSSPTAAMASPPDDIMRRLRQIIDRCNEQEMNDSQSSDGGSKSNSQNSSHNRIQAHSLSGSHANSLSGSNANNVSGIHANNPSTSQAGNPSTSQTSSPIGGRANPPSGSQANSPGGSQANNLSAGYVSHSSGSQANNLSGNQPNGESGGQASNSSRQKGIQSSSSQSKDHANSVKGSDSADEAAPAPGHARSNTPS